MIRYSTKHQPILLRGDLHLFYVRVITDSIKQGNHCLLNSDLVPKVTKPIHSILTNLEQAQALCRGCTLYPQVVLHLFTMHCRGIQLGSHYKIFQKLNLTWNHPLRFRFLANKILA